MRRAPLVGKAGIVFLSTLLGCGGDTTAPDPDPGPEVIEPNSTILLVQGQIQSRVMRARPDGSDSLVLASSADGSIDHLRPAPDGSAILFSVLDPGGGPATVYRVTMNGTGRVPVPAPGQAPFAEWSPDSDRLAWLAREFAGSTIILTDRDGAAPDTVALAQQVAWSPDGGSLAIVYQPGNTDDEVGVIDLDGSRERINITNDAANDDLPAWSPDGMRLAFWSSRPAAPGVYIMSATGAGARRLLPATIYRPPVWSPDGRFLALIDGAGDGAVRVLDAAGQLQPLPDFVGGMTATAVVWSPSSRYILATVPMSAGDQPAGLYYTEIGDSLWTRLDWAGTQTRDAAWIRE